MGFFSFEIFNRIEDKPGDRAHYKEPSLLIRLQRYLSHSVPVRNAIIQIHIFTEDGS